MRKATLVLVTLSALGFGSLVGYSIVDDEPQDTVAAAAPAAVTIGNGGAPAFRYFGPEDIPAGWTEANPGDPYTRGENFVAGVDAWKSETLEIELAGDSRVEYKVFMSQGDSFAFNWRVGGEEIYYDFHAHDDAFGEEFYTRYADGRSTSQSGTIVAAYDGQHGWYWQNLEPDDVTLTLIVAGFYDQILEMDLEGE